MQDQNDVPVFTAVDYVAYLRARGGVEFIPAPRLLIIGFQDDLLEYVAGNYRVEKRKMFGANLYLLKKYHGQIGFINGFGTGAPATAAVVDMFAALGVQKFAIVGLAGGLQSDLQTGSIVLSTGAIRGEGVSNYYLPPGEIVSASVDLLDGVGRALSDLNIDYHEGTTWTTDAPFREFRKRVIEYQKRGVLAVDMEAAGMYSVAKANGCSAMAAFSITDMLADGVWSIPENLQPAKANLGVIFDGFCRAFSDT